MGSSIFPDLNVWLALTFAGHFHHRLALTWLNDSEEASIYFCRSTQVGLLRLLTTRQVMGAAILSQIEAWAAYRVRFQDPRIDFHREPDSSELDRQFHRLSVGAHPSPKRWIDAYLAAFASVAGLTLVTFDQALGSMAPGRSLVLG